MSKNIDTMCINAIRVLSADAIQKANSGHPGLPLGAAAMSYELWANHMKINPKDPQWADRDRFVLSGGHGSMLLYSLLHLFGYGLPKEELTKFRQFGSLTPGHPEYGHTVLKLPPDRWAQASAWQSVWLLRKSTWQRSSTVRATKSSITAPTPSAATAA